MLCQDEAVILCKRFQETGEQEVFDEIYIKARGLIKRTTDIYCKNHFREEWEDMFQEASQAFFMAVKKYDGRNGATFNTFAINCMKHQLIHYTRDSISSIKLPVKMRLTRYKPTILSLEKPTKIDEKITLGDTIKDDINTEEKVIETIYFEQLKDKLKKESHKKVFQYVYMDGLSLADTAKIMNKHHSQISRWHRELKKILEGKIVKNG